MIHLHVKLRNGSLQVGKYGSKEKHDLQAELQDEHKQPQERKLLSKATHTVPSKSVVDTCQIENEFIKCSNWIHLLVRSLHSIGQDMTIETQITT